MCSEVQILKNSALLVIWLLAPAAGPELALLAIEGHKVHVELQPDQCLSQDHHGIAYF